MVGENILLQAVPGRLPRALQRACYVEATKSTEILAASFPRMISYFIPILPSTIRHKESKMDELSGVIPLVDSHINDSKSVFCAIHLSNIRLDNRFRSVCLETKLEIFILSKHMDCKRRDYPIIQC